MHAPRISSRLPWMARSLFAFATLLPGSLLYAAANSLLSGVSKAHPLKDWARRIRKRSGYKKACVAAPHGATRLVFKQHIPLRALTNSYLQQVTAMENDGASADALKLFRGKSRTRDGIFCGDTENGELVAGQICGAIEDIPTVSQLVTRLVDGFAATLQPQTD